MSIKFIKETITYYITKLYIESWFFHHINLMDNLFKIKLSYCNEKNNALRLLYKPQFKYLSKKYKEQLINEKFA